MTRLLQKQPAAPARMGPALVESIMTRACRSCAPGETLDRAAQLMWEGDCGFLPILAADRMVVGVITDRDICMAAYTKGKSLKEIAIREAMAATPRTVKATDRLATAEAVMRACRVRRVPVVDDAGRLAGVLSMNDLARAAARDERLPRPSVTVAEVAETLATICQPRAGVLAGPEECASTVSSAGGITP